MFLESIVERFVGWLTGLYVFDEDSRPFGRVRVRGRNVKKRRCAGRDNVSDDARVPPSTTGLMRFVC